MGRFLRATAIGLTMLAVQLVPVMAQDVTLDRALRQFGAGLAIATDPALVVRGDFNADGLEDVAAIVRGSDRSSFVIFHASDEGFEINPLYRNLPDDVQLRLVEPGRHRVVGPQHTVTIDSPAVELVFPGRSSAMYVWRRDRYQVYGTERLD